MTLIDTISVLLILIIAGFLYFLPSLLAFKERHPNRWLILAINGCLGGTGIVWVCCMIWALHKLHDPDEPGAELSSGGESGLNLFANDVKTFRLADDAPLPGSNDDSHSPRSQIAFGNALAPEALLAPGPATCPVSCVPRTTSPGQESAWFE